MRTLPKAPFLAALVLLGTLLSGCTGEPPQPRALLQASHLIGDDLYAWGDHEFTKPFGVGSTRRIRADLEVPSGVERVGIVFRGSFEWEDNSTALFEIRDAREQRVLFLNATNGRMDDQGEIGSFWQFRPTLQLTPGSYHMTATGTGYVRHLEFQVHGILRDETSVNETFRVDDTDRKVELDVFVQGWGRVPMVTLTAPDGTRTPLAFETPDDDATLTFTPQEGTYRLDADTTAWGGRFVARAAQ